ncbi:MAG: hypothetical protein MZV64_63605 [Ignavibacteriales bacterium]|nr:hypothetical protein [Ignavibacteriales bacterium]
MGPVGEEPRNGQGLELGDEAGLEPVQCLPERARPDVGTDPGFEHAFMDLDRALKGPDDVDQADGRGGPGQDETAPLAAGRYDDPGPGQRLHDLAQVRAGQSEGSGQPGDVGHLAAAPGDLDQGLDGVIGVLVDQFHRGIRYKDTNMVSFCQEEHRTFSDRDRPGLSGRERPMRRGWSEDPAEGPAGARRPPRRPGRR